MKQIAPKIYAQALYQAIQVSEDLDLILKKFAQMLYEHNQLSKFNLVIKEFKKIYNHKQNLVEVDVESVFPLTEKEKLEVVDMVKIVSSAENITIREKIKKNNIGGLKIYFDDVVIDGTIMKKLQTIKNNFKK